MLNLGRKLRKKASDVLESAAPGEMSVCPKRERLLLTAASSETRPVAYIMVAYASFCLSFLLQLLPSMAKQVISIQILIKVTGT